MNVQYTGRQQSITPDVRKLVEARLTKLKKIAGTRAVMEVRVTFARERHLDRVEINVNVFDHPLSVEVETPDLMVSIDEALDRLEKQTVKLKTKWRAKTRHARPAKSRSIRTLGDTLGNMSPQTA